jgi:hypothetical protein
MVLERVLEEKPKMRIGLGFCRSGSEKRNCAAASLGVRSD